MMKTENQEAYTYQINKICYIITPVYNSSGQTLNDILKKLILTEVESPQEPCHR